MNYKILHYLNLIRKIVLFRPCLDLHDGDVEYCVRSMHSDTHAAFNAMGEIKLLRHYDGVVVVMLFFV